MSMTPETQQVYDRGFDDGYETGYVEATNAAANRVEAHLSFVWAGDKRLVSIDKQELVDLVLGNRKQD